MTPTSPAIPANRRGRRLRPSYGAPGKTAAKTPSIETRIHTIAKGAPPVPPSSSQDPILERLRRVYVAVVSDALDTLGLRHQVMAPRVRPLYPEARIVGRAHPIHFRPAERIPSREEYHYMEIEAMDSLLPGEVYVAALGDAPPCALWGELFSTCAQAQGAAGAVIDGPVRDSAMIIAKPYPVFATRLLRRRRRRPRRGARPQHTDHVRRRAGATRRLPSWPNTTAWQSFPTNTSRQCSAQPRRKCRAKTPCAPNLPRVRRCARSLSGTGFCEGYESGGEPRRPSYPRR